MLININKLYYFTFITGFEKLNGIYEVTQIKNFQELLSEKVDLGSSLYELVGKTKEDYESDSDSYRPHKVYKLLNPENGTTIYLPHPIIKNAPDPNIKRYLKLVISLDLGVYDDVESLEHVSRIMQEHIAGTTGILKDPEFLSYGYKWMTEAQYSLESADRDESLKKVINFFSECRQLRATIERLNKKVEALENIIISTQQP